MPKPITLICRDCGRIETFNDLPAEAAYYTIPGWGRGPLVWIDNHTGWESRHGGPPQCPNCEPWE